MTGASGHTATLPPRVAGRCDGVPRPVVGGGRSEVCLDRDCSDQIAGAGKPFPRGRETAGTERGIEDEPVYLGRCVRRRVRRSVACGGRGERRNGCCAVSDPRD
jgi:hypothetical protein